jgi:hypothetical protein
MSEGGCGCYEEEEDARIEQLWERLQHASMKIDGMTIEATTHALTDELGRDLAKGELEYRLYIDEHDGCDELVFTAESWAEVKKALELTEDPSPPEDM